MIPPFVPYGTDRERKRIPYVTYTVIGLNVLFYLALHTLGSPEAVSAAVLDLGFVPAQGRWYSALTSMFLHLNPFHLLQNMVFLWVFGSLVEEVLGVALFATLLVGSQLASNLLHAAVGTAFGSANVGLPVIGASGAVAGLLGLAAVRFYRTRLRIAYWVVVKTGVVEVAAWVFIALWVAAEGVQAVVALAEEQAGLGGADLVARWAHLGGFAFGMVGGLVLGLRPEGQQEYLLEELRRDPLSVSGYNVVRELQRLARATDNPGEVHHALAKQYLLEQEYVQAGHSFLRAIDGYLRRDDRAGAAQAYEELVACYPECLLNLRNQFAVGLALEQQGRYSLAAHVFERLADAYPESDEAPVSLMRAGALCAQRLADPSGALRYLERVVREYPHGRWADLARQQAVQLRRALGR